MRIATPLLLAALVVAALPPAHAQNPALADDYVFFFDRANPGIVVADGTIVPDPENEDNPVLEIPVSTGDPRGFRWPSSSGIDASQNQADGDTLFLRYRSDPANDEAGVPRIEFQDTFVGSEGDLPFRAVWIIPDDLNDGEWHDLVVPLPPATYNELEAAKDAAEEDDPIQNWFYNGAGANNADGEPVGTDGLGPNTAENPDEWTEFQWDAVRTFGFKWDLAEGEEGGPVYVDNFYIGSSDYDPASAEAQPAAYAGSLAPVIDGSTVTVSFTPQEGVGFYRPYFSDSPITDLTDTTAVIPGQVIPAGGELSFSYTATRPHPNYPLDETVHYTVTTQNVFGDENTATVGTTGSTSLVAETWPAIYQITADAADALITSMAARIIDTDPLDLDDHTPFYIGGEEAFKRGTEPSGPADLEGNLWMAFAEDSEDAENTLFFVYFEVTDDSLVVIADNDGDGRKDAGCCEEQYDNLSIYFGTYRVDGSALVHNDHVGMQQTGAEPDYGIRFTLLDDSPANGPIDGALTGIDLRHTSGGSSANPGQLLGQIVAPVIEPDLANSSYRVLAVFGARELVREEALAGPEPDALFQRPAADEVVAHPMMVVYEDNDAVQFSSADRTGNYTTPRPDLSARDAFFTSAQQWPATAVEGIDVVITSSEDETAAPTFALAQNYPNPFAEATQIDFELSAAVPVTLEVFNVLGQRVAVLADEPEMAPGTHSVSFRTDALANGVYVYRLRAGDFEATRRMLVLR